MVEAGIATQSIPPQWFEDDRMLLTILDVMQVQAERAKQRKGRR